MVLENTKLMCVGKIDAAKALELTGLQTSNFFIKN